MNVLELIQALQAAESKIFSLEVVVKELSKRISFLETMGE